MKVMILMVSDELHIKVKELALDNYTSMSEIVRKSILTSIDRNTFVKLPEKIRHLNREEWRDKIKIRDNYICQHCGLQMDKYIALAHHILSKKKGGKNVLENGITLCRDCHFKIHQKIKKSWR